jgi:hypothetical protein
MRPYKTLHICTEAAGERARIDDELQEIMRSQYNSLSSIADDIQALDYATASAVLKERLPQTSKARPGAKTIIIKTLSKRLSNSDFRYYLFVIGNQNLYETTRLSYPARCRFF